MGIFKNVNCQIIPVTCHFEDDLEIFLDKLDGYEWKKSFRILRRSQKRAILSIPYDGKRKELHLNDIAMYGMALHACA
jgi:hypothetical protein